MRLALTALVALAIATPIAVSSADSDRSPQPARTFRVDCDSPRQTISRALAHAREGDVIFVKGTCRETLVLDKPITLDGGGTATIAPPKPSDWTITVNARDVTVRGFKLDAPAVFQFFIYNAATVTIESNIIRNAQNFGVSAAANSNVVLLGNTITDNGLGGIIGLSGTEYGIGSRISFDPPQPNVIADNGGFGVVLISNASARILGGNTISGQNIGIVVQDGAQARIAGNIIDGNNIGVFVDVGGVVQLPLVSNAVALFTELNSGVNTSLGIGCKGGTIRGLIDGMTPAVRLPPTPGALAGPPVGLATHCLDQTETLAPAAP
jgi:parallel beta-helix repeat protein